METFLFYGRNGKLHPTPITSLEELQRYGKAPYLELDVKDCFRNNVTICDTSLCKSEIGMACAITLASNVLRVAQMHYGAWEEYGFDGDVIKITVNTDEGNYKIDLIGRLTFPKPGLTADLVPFVRDGAGKLFFLGIIRGAGPGLGEPAYMAGFREVNGTHFVSAAETAITEGREETGLRVKPLNQDWADRVRNEIDIPEFRAEVTLGTIVKQTCVKLVGRFHTSEDKIPRSRKRVHETTAYAFLINVEEVLTEELLAQMLTAGDDAAAIYVWCYDPTNDSRPPLAFGHHTEIFEEALNMALHGQLAELVILDHGVGVREVANNLASCGNIRC